MHRGEREKKGTASPESQGEATWTGENGVGENLYAARSTKGGR